VVLTLFDMQFVLSWTSCKIL